MYVYPLVMFEQYAFVIIESPIFTVKYIRLETAWFKTLSRVSILTNFQTGPQAQPCYIALGLVTLP